MLSDRVNRIAASPTLKINARAQQMRAAGIDVIDLSVGEPDFPTPEVVKQAGKAAIDANFTKYTANDGILELRKAICEKLERDNQLSYAPDEILVSPGAKLSLFNLALALFSPGDDILIPAPYWVSYPDQVVLSGANPVYLNTKEEEGFKLMPSDLAGAITPNTKALILNYPSNPTGACYSRGELAALAEICVKEGIVVISDEIYEKLVYDGIRFVSIASVDPKIKKQTVVVNGFSKAFSMTGWRLGYMAGPKEIVSACSKIQSHSTSNATSFVQKAAVTALRSCAMDIERMRQEFERRRNMVVYRLRALPGVSASQPQGAFYVMPNVARYLDKEFQGSSIRNTYGLAYYLLKEAKVAVVPGEAFGTGEHIRLSFAASMERLEEGLRRIGQALARLEEPRRARPRALNNVVTKVSAYTETRSLLSVEERNGMVAEAEAHLPAEAYFEWNASLAGVVVQLRTNSPHLADFYQENFFPAAQEAEVAPHAVVYAVKDFPGRVPSAALSLNTATGFVFNTAFYGQVRSQALALAGDALARTAGNLFVHAAALNRDGRGILAFGGPGSGRTGILAAALAQDGVKLVSTDSLVVRMMAREPLAETMERKFYLKAKWATHLREVEKFFDASKLENLVTHRGQCGVEYCKHTDDCPLDRGAAACPLASKDGRILLDPHWLGAGKRFTRRTAPRVAVFLAKDPVLPSQQELSARDAARMLARGQFPGSKSSLPFLNPHLRGLDSAHADAMAEQFERLFSGVRPVMINSGIGSAEAIARRILDLAR